MAKQVAVIGLGRFGSTVATELYKSGNDVLAIDKNEAIIQEMMGSVTYSLNADATSEHALRDLGIPGFNTVVVAIGTDVQASLLTTVLLKELGVPQIVGRANNHLHEEALLRLGADRVVNPERDTAVKLAHDIFHPETVEYMELSKSYGISKITPPEHFFGKTLGEVGLHNTNGAPGKKDRGKGKHVIVLAIIRGLEPILVPSGEEDILRGDLLIITGEPDSLEKASPS